MPAERLDLSLLDHPDREGLSSVLKGLKCSVSNNLLIKTHSHSLADVGDHQNTSGDPQVCIKPHRAERTAGSERTPPDRKLSEGLTVLEGQPVTCHSFTLTPASVPRHSEPFLHWLLILWRLDRFQMNIQQLPLTFFHQFMRYFADKQIKLTPSSKTKICSEHVGISLRDYHSRF